MKVLIIDYGMGNVGSVKRALEECEVYNVVISNDHADFEDCTHAILPGVGAFPDAMKNLEKYGLTQKILKLTNESNIPLLGICLGMQLLATKGREVHEYSGLNLIPGEILLMDSERERIPHIGWNEINIKSEDSMLAGIPDKSDFYFVHSYHFSTDDPSHVLATTPYCGEFVSIVRHRNIIGTQFHPEKSSTTGFKLLRNFLEL